MNQVPKNTSFVFRFTNLFGLDSQIKKRRRGIAALFDLVVGYGRLKALTRNTAISARVTELSGQ